MERNASKLEDIRISIKNAVFFEMLKIRLFLFSDFI